MIAQESIFLFEDHSFRCVHHILCGNVFIYNHVSFYNTKYTQNLYNDSYGPEYNVLSPLALHQESEPTQVQAAVRGRAGI